MAYHYVDCDRDQMFLLPASMRDWLEEGHLAWFVIDVVARINTDTFHARHPNDGAGRPAYNPVMMLALLFYAYGTGVRSSRRIEQLCHTDAAYRVIWGRATADHATIDRFTTDPESRIMKTATGFVQGYNAQAAVNAHQIVVAAAVTQEANDVAQYQPMI